MPTGGGRLQEERRASSHPEGPRALLAKGAAGYHVRLLREAGAEDGAVTIQGRIGKPMKDLRFIHFATVYVLAIV